MSSGEGRGHVSGAHDGARWAVRPRAAAHCSECGAPLQEEAAQLVRGGVGGGGEGSHLVEDGASWRGVMESGERAGG